MTFMTTRAQRRQNAARRAAFDVLTDASIARERTTISDEQRRKNLYAACVAEVEQENAAQREKEFAPVREYEKTLNADRERAARNARAALFTGRDYPHFKEVCAPFSQYAGAEGDYLDAVRNTFIDFKERLASQGVEITQAGLETLAELSDDNLSLNWADLQTFDRVWEHAVEVGYLKEGSAYTVTTQPEPAPVAKQEPDLESFDTLLKTRSVDDPELRNAARDAAIREAQPLFSEWASSLLNAFGYVIPLEVAKHVERWFIQNNRSFLDRTAYDACRRASVREGLMPRTCLTFDDISGEEMDGLDIRTTEGRRRAAQLHREGLRRQEEALQNQAL